MSMGMIFHVKLKTLKYLSVPLMVQQFDVWHHVKPVLRDIPDHIVFHIGTNDVPSNKTPETIAESILDLAISSKSTTCDVSILNILIRKDKHQLKAQEVDSYLKKLFKKFNIHYIDQHLNKLRLHLSKRCTSVFSSNFIREISNVFHWKCVLRRPSAEFDTFSAEYKSKGNDINHLKLICKTNLNKLVVAHLNINSVRKKLEALI